MRKAPKQSQQKLKDATRLIRTMREVAMITRGDGKYSQAIETQTREQRDPTYSRPEDQQAAGMQKNKLRRGEVIQAYLR